MLIIIIIVVIMAGAEEHIPSDRIRSGHIRSDHRPGLCRRPLPHRGYSFPQFGQVHYFLNKILKLFKLLVLHLFVCLRCENTQLALLALHKTGLLLTL